MDFLWLHIEHAEVGATPKGDDMTGFQIWLNIPSSLPQKEITPGFNLRLLAGPLGDRIGRFRTKTSIQMIDIEVEPNKELIHTIPEGMTPALYTFTKDFGFELCR